MSRKDPPVEYVTVVCKTCGTRVDERVTDDSRQVQCPDCFQAVTIPARSELPPPAASQPTPDPGVYQLRGASPESTRKRGRQKSRTSSARDVLVVCRTCKARLHPPLRAESYRVRCPDCDRPVRVPSPAEAAEEEERRRPQAREVEPIEALPVPRAAPRQRASTFYTAQTAHIRREKEQPPPASTWFSGVWTFPWQPGVLMKWVFLSIGCTLLNGLAFAALMVGVLTGRSGFAAILLAFVALPAIWIFLWSVSYGASHWLAVITETAAGNQRIEEWPEQGWRDGIFSFLALFYLWGVSALVGHVAGLGSEALGGSYWLVVDVTIGLLFPFLTLSMLETGTWYLPFSGPVTRSLAWSFGDWVACYVLLGAAFGGFSFLWGLAVVYVPVLTILISGGVWAALILISSRLLGRLAWRIMQNAPDEPE